MMFAYQLTEAFRAEGQRAAHGLRRLRASAVLKLAVLVLGLGAWDSGLSAAPAAITNRPAPASLDESSFKLITQNNIFNPKRYKGYTRTERPSGNQKPRADYFALVGIMNYEKGSFAFFEGSSSQYQKIAKASDSIAGFKVIGIESNAVQLVSGTNTVAMPIDMQMRREEGSSDWKLALRTDTVVASYDRSDRSRNDRNDRNGRSRFNNSRDNVSRDNFSQFQPPTDGTNQAPDVMTAGSDAVGSDSPDFPPPPDAVSDQGSGTNEDPVLRLLRLRRERESNP
jgi:hypothetical protein